jgi:phospholipid-binding lipoprotein MlaA
VFLTVILIGVSLCAGCAGGQTDLDPRDPWEPTNRDMYNYNDGLDQAILAPVAEQYVKLPQGARNSVRNFFINLGYPTTVVNQFLQGKVERGFEDTMRFIFNTTFGILGLFDFAGGIGLPRHVEDFGQTFAVWGAPSGPYMVIPLLGPSTVRDAAGIPLDFLTKPLFWIETPGEFFALAGLDLVDTRARLIPAIRLRDETAFDPYIFTREAFLQQRLNLIYDGDPPLEDLDDLELLDEVEEKELENEESRKGQTSEQSTQ